ncbi:aryl-sulfate sulfotransferase [Mangrovibacter phragmitis]|uniref:aryl-sulfate sulfotransferase n=1 Tax=Mangrovibacter phragmitis TaxID=1691903 RepID=UPI00336A229E
MSKTTSTYHQAGLSRRGFLGLGAAVTVAALVHSRSAFSMPTVFPTGVTIHDKSATYVCDVMFSTSGKTYLIDINGLVVKQWEHKGEPARIVDPSLVGGRKGVAGMTLDMVDASRMPNLAGIGLVPGRKTAKINKTFGLLDWNGNVIWQWSGIDSVGAALQHHDWELLSNGNMLILSDRMREDPRFKIGKIVDDVIYEITPSGKVVWQWSATDHLDEFGFTPEEMKLVTATNGPDYLHMNAMAALGPNRWEMAGDKRFAAENIIFSSRNANFIAIIDRKTGRIVWRIGPNYPHLTPAETGKLPHPVNQMSGQHNAHMIPEGLPGAGNILVFDDQGEAGYPIAPRALLGGSRILEIDPATREIVWQYTASMSGNPDSTFFSPFVSGAQRLPNGNTLIDEGIDGRFFQVTPTGKIVWEYIVPFTGIGPGGTTGHPVESNLTYRAQAVPLNWIPR